MPMDLFKALVETVAERPDAARLAEPDLGSVIDPHDPRPLDWGQAVDAAAARLDESWVQPDLTGHMLALGLADELAATLCAYGMVATEVEHMHDHADKLAGRRPGTQEENQPA